MLGIIGGSGLSKLGILQHARSQAMPTPYGEPSGELTLGRVAGREVVFLPRHGYEHAFAPHQVNYRANLWALKHSGCLAVLSIASVGGIRAHAGPGSLLVPDQIIDYTWGRQATYFEGPHEKVSHIDFTHPYSPALRRKLLAAAAACGEAVADGGVYAATQGPRLETAAEVNRLERDGADVVGMTGMPEASLAREIGLDYAALAVVVNHAAGRGDAARAIPLERIDAIMQAAMARVRRIIEKLCETHDS
ncbi:MAG: S-methyl-5'-thioinosine phosphorylase [Betaproteobacteria bacterium]